LNLGVITATYGDFTCSSMLCFSNELSSDEVQTLHDLFKNKKIYEFIRGGRK